MAVRVVLLTGAALRHDFVRKALGLAPGLELAASYCEESRAALPSVIDDTAPGAELQRAHLAGREASEQDFFGPFVHFAPDESNPRHVAKGAVNEPAVAEEIADLAPDVLAAYGCSIVREPLLSAFSGRFVNVHLGLSPYYRGSGTNFWPLVNGEPEYVGATFMHIDAGVDTGEIIYQIRARVLPGDTPHQIGNRLIADMTRCYARLLAHFRDLPRMEQPKEPAQVRVCTRAQFSPEATRTLYDNFASGLVQRYLAEREAREAAVPLVVNPLLAGCAEQGGAA